MEHEYIHEWNTNNDIREQFVNKKFAKNSGDNIRDAFAPINFTLFFNLQP